MKLRVATLPEVYLVATFALEPNSDVPCLLFGQAASPIPPIMSFFSNTNPTAVASTNSTSGDKDIEVSDPPTDSISSLSFSSQADYLAVGSWDNSVRTLLFLRKIGYHNLLFDRSEFMRSAQGVKHKARRCTNIKALSCRPVGTRWAQRPFFPVVWARFSPLFL